MKARVQDEDPFEIEPGLVKDIPVEMTVIGWEIVYRSAEEVKTIEGEISR